MSRGPAEEGWGAEKVEERHSIPVGVVLEVLSR